MAKYKIKTNRRAAKTFKITGTGKITHRASNNSHKAIKRSQARNRRLDQETVVTGKTAKRIALLLPGKF
ncbi:MAG TPA: 50S ribosomal protein L35 [Armatimonadota bacterium]|jgi:large subunit ribosomal protein L35